MTVSWNSYISIALLLWRWRIKCGLFSKQESNNMAVEKEEVTVKFYGKWYFPVITWYKNIHWSKFYQQYTHWIKRFLQLLLLKICELILFKLAQTCSVKKVFLEIPQNSQENTCARVSFLIKLQASPATLLQKRPWHWCFPVNFAKFLRTPFFTQHLWWLLLYFGLYESPLYFHRRYDLTNTVYEK